MMPSRKRLIKKDSHTSKPHIQKLIKKKSDEKYHVRQVSTFSPSKRERLEQDERTKFAFMKNTRVNFQFRRRSGWQYKRRRMTLNFMVIYKYLKVDEYGAHEVIYQKSFYVNMVTTSYLWASRVAEKIIAKVRKAAEQEFGKKNVIGVYLSSIDVGERTDKSSDLDNAILHDNKRTLLKRIT